MERRTNAVKPPELSIAGVLDASRFARLPLSRVVQPLPAEAGQIAAEPGAPVTPPTANVSLEGLFKACS